MGGLGVGVGGISVKQTDENPCVEYWIFVCLQPYFKDNG